MSIRIKGALFITIASLLAVFVSGLYFMNRAEQKVNESFENVLKTVVTLKSQELRIFLQEEIDDVKFIASLDQVLFFDGENIDETNSLLEKIQKEHQRDIHTLSIVDARGEIVASSQESERGKLRSIDLLDLTHISEKIKVKNFYFDTTLEKVASIVVHTLDNPEYQLVGKINMSEIDSVINNVTGLGSTGETLILNNFRFLINETRFESEEKGVVSINTDIAKLCLGNKDNGFAKYKDYRGKDVVGYYEYLHDNDVCMIAKIEENEIYSSTKELQRSLLIGIGISAASTLIFVWVFAYILTRPIDALKAASNEYIKGNFDHVVKVSTHDEFQTLAQSFNTMAADISEYKKRLNVLNKHLEAEVEKRTRELESKKQELQKFNDILVGREVKMAELKKQIKKLKNDL